jgi:hypothetical protein
MFHRYKKFFCFVFLLFLFFLPMFGTAQGTAQGGADAPTTDTGTVSLDNPLGTESPQVLIGNVINAVLGVVGSLALLMFIYGGFTWMTASGNSEKVQQGKNILLWAIIGLVVIFTSYALVNFVIQDVISPGGGGSTPESPVRYNI